MARLNSRKKGVTALALLATLALAIGVIAGPVAGASGGGTASIAKKKKKCKPGFVKVKVKVKVHGKVKTRKRCRKVSALGTSPVIRATITWSKR